MHVSQCSVSNFKHKENMFDTLTNIPNSNYITINFYENTFSGSQAVSWNGWISQAQLTPPGELELKLFGYKLLCQMF